MLKFKTLVANYLGVIALPLGLAVLFVIQNQAFNRWLDLYAKAYSARLSFVAFALGIVFYGPALLFRKRYKYIYLCIISSLVSLIFIAQFLYYRYSQSFLQFSAIRYLNQAGSVLGTAKTLLSAEILLFLCSVVVVIIAFIFASKRKYEEFVLPNWEKVIIVLVMLGMVFFGYKYLLYTEKKEWGSTSRLYTDVYDLKALVGKMGIMNFFLEDTFKYILRRNLTTDSDKQFLKDFAEKKNRLSASRAKPAYAEGFGLAKGKNLIIIQVESLETAVIDRKINGQEITPNLNSLAKNGLYFANFYAQVGPGNTADTEFSTMNSLYPLADSVVFIDYAKNDYTALPQLLVENGYRTYSLHGDVPTFWNRSNIYPELGYQKVFDLSDYTVTRSVGKGPSDLGDEDLFSQSLPKLQSLKQPFMATIITMSSHTPFLLPDDLQELKISEDLKLDWIQAAYLQSMHYTDRAIGGFIDKLKSVGLYDNSLILIWGDHGSFTNISQALGQTNFAPELSNSRVPFIALVPGASADLQGASYIPASQLDVYPTITNLLGIVPPKTILGQDLLNSTNPVETHFKLVSGGIDTILTNDLVYRANEDGAFSHGFCETLTADFGASKSLPISDCQSLYTQQLDTIKASNIIIRGNLLNFYNSNLSK